MSRFLIIGPSGSGKSTLSRQISQQLDIPFVETDQIYWRSDWTLAPNEEVIGQLLLDRESWVIDNNFVDHRPQVWEAADTIIWLSYSFSTVFRRLAIRNLSWCIFPQKTWTGKRMPVSRSISGIIAKNIWKGHFVIVALLVLGFPAGVYYSMPRLAENFNFEEMLFL